MNKTELIDKIVEKTGMPKAGIDKFLNAFTETVTETLTNGEKVQMIGFGTFETRARGPRQARNPKDGSIVKVPASKAPVFKVGKALKDAVNK